jgi:hypothetical protein
MAVLNVNRSGRGIVVMVMNPVFVVAKSVTVFASITFPAIRKGDTSAKKKSKSYNW